MTYKQAQLLDDLLSRLRKDNGLRPDDMERDVGLYARELSAKLSGLKADVTKAVWQILIDDGYIVSDKDGRRITAKGILFNENEGYVYRKRVATISIILQSISTGMIAVGAGGLLILELQKYHANCLCK